MRRPMLFFALLSLSFLALQAGATGTKIWMQRSYGDFSAGEVKGVSISSKGEVRLSFKLDKLGDIKENFVWDVVEDAQGNLFIGTGKEGRVYRISSDGKSELFFDSPEVNVHALLINSNGDIYAGTAPDGLIFKITPDGAPSTLFSSGEKYVWDLAIDGSGNIYAATGPNGKIFKVTPEGAGEVLFDSEESNIMCLQLRDDTLYAGSDKNGIIYAISLQTGKVSVIYDASEKEIHALAIDQDGNIYAAATIGAPPQPGGPRGEQEERKSSIYMISPDGLVRKIWTSPEPLILSLSFDPENRLLVGTGDSGKLYSVTSDGQFTMLAKCEASQVLSIFRSSDSIYVATGNGGGLYKLSSERSQEGEITSKVFDTSIVSRWGNILWEAIAPQGTSILFATRSGNTSKPDNTWSEWSEDYTVSDGSPIKSPQARFIQWRAKLQTSDPTQTPTLKSVWVTYLQGNVPPQITKISVDGDDSRRSQPGRGPAPPQRGPSPREGAKGRDRTKTIKWQVRDPNGDKLIFSVYLKGVDEGNWRLLEEKLEKSSYQFDSSTLPDGWYHVKLVASDLPSNPSDISKITEKISDPFLIDNSQPTISDISVTASGDQIVVVFSVSDPTSLLKSASYSLDNQDWMVLFPDDGIFDSKKESFKVTLKGLDPGAHTISVKIADIAGNVASARKGFSR
jgi:sugar lactone lactonase YvrE